MALLNFPRTPQQRIDGIRFKCSCCQNWKSGLMDLTKILPDPVLGVPEDERSARAKISDDLCSLDGEHFFVRSVLYLPILQTESSFGFGVWGSLAEKNFRTYVDEFDNPTPEFGPFFSWLCSSLPPYEATAGLKAELDFQPNNQRPLIHLHESDHPLAIAQREGITIDNIEKIYAAWGHSALI
jgi:hypothetical protein